MHCLSEYVDCGAQSLTLVQDLPSSSICHCYSSSALESADVHAYTTVIFYLLSYVGVKMSVVLQSLFSLLSIAGMTDEKVLNTVA